MSTDNDDDDVTVEQLNTRAIVGLVASVVIGVIGLFLLPALRDLGLSFWTAFWSLLALEFLAFVGVAVSVLRLHEERSFE